MFTFNKGRRIARVDGGQHDGDYICIFEEGKIYPCCNKCNPETCIKKKGKCCDDCEITKGGCLQCNGGSSEKNRSVCNMSRLDLLKRNERGIEHLNGSPQIEIPDGIIQPLPNPEKAEDGSYLADDIFVAGPQGVGKSTFIGKYIGEERKLHPKKDVIIFSAFEQDKPLDVYNPMRIKIDQHMIEKPIKKEECKNSICVFDDVDTLQPKNLALGCRALRDDFLQCGRKENIKVFATSHQLMNFNKTRDLLNSCNKTVFFPQGTSAHHIRRFLSVYAGLDPKCIKYILKIGSRWLLIDKNFPSYILSEHGAIILNKLPELLDIDKLKKNMEIYAPGFRDKLNDFLGQGILKIKKEEPEEPEEESEEESSEEDQGGEGDESESSEEESSEEDEGGEGDEESESDDESESDQE